MAFGIAITRALPLYPRSVFIQWDLKDVTEAGNYLFTVQRGESAEGPWTTLVTGATNIYNYLDTFPALAENDPNLLAVNRYQTLYKVTVTPPSGAENAVSVVSAIDPKLEGRQKLLKRKALRDQAVMLRKLNGVDIAVLKRRHWGPRCTKCYDKYTKETMRGACTTCYGTGFIGGYHTPVVTLGRRGTAHTNTQLTPQGKSDTLVTHLVIMDAPKVEQDDILVFLHDNRRFQVKDVGHTEIKTVTVHQKLVLSELAHSSIEYRIPVDPLRVPPLF